MMRQKVGESMDCTDDLMISMNCSGSRSNHPESGSESHPIDFVGAPMRITREIMGREMII